MRRSFSMRKLKLQVQMSLDGFVAGPNGELDWMTWEMDDKSKKFVNDLTDSVDTILLGRKMTEGFISYWTNVKPESEQYSFARKMVEKPKYVFSNTLTKSNWENTTIVNGDLKEEINNIKYQNRDKDIIVYGGATFVSSLIKNNLIDEYYLIINPTAIGKGLRIFDGIESKLKLTLINSTYFDNGKVVNQYKL
jgi:dihydrofolate reductase